MLSRQHFMILERTGEAEYITAENLAKELKISDRSVRKRIQEINAELKEQQIQILSRARYGYYMEEQSRSRLKAFLEERKTTEKAIPVTGEERVQFLMVYLLNHTGYIRMDDLCEILFVSKGTLTIALKQVEKLYGNYQIQIERRPNYGIRAVGEEYDVRRLLCEICVRQEFLWDAGKARQKQKLKQISGIVLRNVKKYDIRLSERAYQDFVDYISVALYRIRKDCRVKVETSETDYIEKKEYYFTEAVVSELQEQYEVSWSDNEKIALALQLIGKNIKEYLPKEEMDLLIRKRISQVVSQVLEAVLKEYKIDFRNNTELQKSLTQHMIPMDIRLRYGISMENPILEEIRENYQLAFSIASYAAVILQEIYDTEVSEAETGYLALIFELALDKAGEGIEKKSILIVCGSGRGSAQLLKHKLQKEFSSYIEFLYVSSAYELEAFDFSKVQYVLTTIPIEMPVPVPVLMIHEFMERDDIYNIRSMLENGSEEFFREYFPEALFFPKLEAIEKEEILKELVGNVQRVHPMPDDFLEAVLERDALSTTDFGNLSAIPHPARLMSDETFVAVGISEVPVLWGRNQVQVIFLTSVGTKEDMNIQKFYETTMRFLSNKEAVKTLIQCRDYRTFIELLRGAKQTIE